MSKDSKKKIIKKPKKLLSESESLNKDIKNYKKIIKNQQMQIDSLNKVHSDVEHYLRQEKQDNEILRKNLDTFQWAHQQDLTHFLSIQYKAIFKEHALDIEKTIEKSANDIIEDTDKLTKVSDYLMLFMKDNKGYINKIEEKQEINYKSLIRRMAILEDLMKSINTNIMARGTYPTEDIS